MTRRRMTVMLVLLAGVLLLVGIQVGWSLRGPPEGLRELGQLLSSLKPSPATDADWKNVSVERGTVRVAGAELPVMTAQRILPVFEAEGDTSAHHLLVRNTRTTDTMKTLVWSAKANNALEFDWLAPSASKAPRPVPDVTLYRTPEDMPMQEKGRGQYLIGTLRSYTGATDLMIGTPAGDTRLPWTRPSQLLCAYFFRGLRYAACLEQNDQTHKIMGMAIIDIQKRELGGIVDLPPQVGRYPPLLLIDGGKDLLLCFDLSVAWIVCVDLRPARLAAEAADKQAPPSEKKDP